MGEREREKEKDERERERYGRVCVCDMGERWERGREDNLLFLYYI